MAATTSNFLINIIAQTIGMDKVREAKAQLDALNRAATASYGSGFQVTGLKKIEKDAQGATTAVVQLKNELTGATINASATTSMVRGAQITPLLPSGFSASDWKQKAWGGKGAWFDRTAGNFVARSDPRVASYSQGPIAQGLHGYNTELETLSATTGKAAKATENFFTQQGKLAARALVVVPIWMAMRTAIQAVTSVIGSGAQSIIDMDEALINTKNELVGSVKDLDGFMEKLKGQAVSLSKETGVSVVKVIESFRMFATAGIDAETSLAGMNSAVKGSVATMGDSVETARLLADVYNQFGERITEVSGTQNKFNYIMSSMAALMPTNVFTMQEFNAGLTNFLGTAKAANLTLDQTFTLVAVGSTLMQRGARGGTQLSSAFEQLANKSKEVRDFIGILPEGTTRFDQFVAVIQKAAEIGKKGGVLPQDIAEIFGMRGGRMVKADIAGFSKFVEELERMKSLTPDDRMAMLLERYGNASEKIKLLFSQIKETSDDLVRSFIYAALGTDNFADSLKEAKKVLEDMKPLLELLGNATKFGVIQPIQAAGTSLSLLSTLGELEAQKRARDAQIGAAAASIPGISFSDLSSKSPEELTMLIAQYKEMQSGRSHMINNIPVNQTSGIGDLGTISVSGVKGELGTTEESRVFTIEQQVKLMEQMKALGYNELQIEKMKYDMLVEDAKARKDVKAQLEAEYNLVVAINKEILEFSSKLQSTFQGGLSDILMGNSTLSNFGDSLTKTVRQGFADAVTGNITDQLFQATGIGNMFGGMFSNIRHGGDKTKISADYFSDKIKSVADYFASRLGMSGTSGIAGGMFGTGGFSGGGLTTLPGFGSGGWMNQPLGSPTYGNYTSNGSNYGTSTYTPYQRSSGATPSQLLGLTMTTVGSGAAGAAGGGVVGGVLGGLGGLGLGIGALQAGAETGIFAAGGMLGSSLIPIVGLVFALGSMIYSMTQSPPKWSQVQTQESTKQIGSRIDITNKQLEWVNRNLVGMRQELSYVMQESYYFRQRPVEEQFQIDSMRGSA